MFGEACLMSFSIKTWTLFYIYQLWNIMFVEEIILNKHNTNIMLVFVTDEEEITAEDVNMLP